MIAHDKAILTMLEREIRRRMSLRQWKAWKTLTNKLFGDATAAFAAISEMNGALAAVFDLAGLGGDFTFENLLHTFICLTLRKKKENATAKFLREVFDKPYASLDHFKRARFQYDARAFVDIQGVIHPSKRELLDDMTHRIVVTGDYTLLVPRDPADRDVSLLFIHHLTSRVVIPERIAGYRITRLGDYLFYSQRTLHELTIPDSVPLRSFGKFMCAHCEDLICVYYGSPGRVRPLDFNTEEIRGLKCFNACPIANREAGAETPDSVTLDSQVASYTYNEDRKRCLSGSEPASASYRFTDAISGRRIKRLLTLNENCFEIEHAGFRLDEEKSCKAYRDEKIDLTIKADNCSHLSKLGTYAFRNNADLFTIDLSGSVVTRIEFAAFSRCGKLQKIVFPETLQYISPTAFHLCKNLKTITFGKDGKIFNNTFKDGKISNNTFKDGKISNNTFKDGKISNNTFKDGKISNNTFIIKKKVLFTAGMRTLLFVLKGAKEKKVKKLIESSPIVHIGAFAFSVQPFGDKKKTIRLPEGITFIGENAFYGNKNLKKIELPKSLMGIGPCVFSGTPSLHFGLASDHPFFKLFKNNPRILCSRDGTRLISGCAYGSTSDGSFPLSLKDVKEICAGAFQNTAGPDDRQSELALTDLKALEYIAEYSFEKRRIELDFSSAKRLKAIGKSAFCDCIFPENTELKFAPGLRWIGREAFKGCKGVSGVAIPKTVEYIGKEAFCGCPLACVEFASGLRWIGRRAFKGCTKLTAITIPGTVEYIGKEAFCGSTLERVVIKPGLRQIDQRAFKGCTKLKEIKIPGTVKHIGEEAFCDCLLERVKFASGLRQIGRRAFTGCTKLTEIVIPKTVEYIGDGAFDGCPLERVEFAHGTRQISGCAFKGCTKLKEIIIPGTVEYIDDKVFNDCPLERVVIQSGLRQIDQRAFKGCTKLKEIIIPGTVKHIGEEAFCDCPLERVEFASGLRWIGRKSGLRQIGRRAFTGCTKLTEIVIPKTVEYIGDGAFDGCPLKSVVLMPDRIRIDPSKFKGCTKLTEIVIPKTVEYIGDGAFDGCPLERVEFAHGTRQISDCAFKGCSTLKEIAIPDTVMYIGWEAFCGSTLERVEFASGLRQIGRSSGLSQIGRRAFKGCTKLTEITIPDTVVYIGEEAFCDCPLERVVFATGLHWIDQCAFKGCTKLTEITIPDTVVYIGEEAFCDCPLERVEFASGLRQIDQRAFKGCTKLKEIIIPGTVRHIGEEAFCGSTLERVVIKPGLRQIGQCAFKGCTKLTEIAIPDTVMYIGEEAFCNCPLERVEFASGLCQIGQCAFKGCTKLKEIIIPGTVKHIGKEAFCDCLNLNTIRVPKVLMRLIPEALGAQNKLFMREEADQNTVRFVRFR